MLDTVIQSTPLALVLTQQCADHVLYSNSSARQLFGERRKLEGACSSQSSRPRRCRCARPSIVWRHVVHAGGWPASQHVYHVSQRRFLAQRHAAPCCCQAADARDQLAGSGHGKKVIRVIAHELNIPGADHLAGHSGQILAHAPPDPAQLARVSRPSVNARGNLAGFIEGYSQFAKLPKPRVAPVSWAVLLGAARGVVFRLWSGPGASASFDAAQPSRRSSTCSRRARVGPGADESNLR